MLKSPNASVLLLLAYLMMKFDLDKGGGVEVNSEISTVFLQHTSSRSPVHIKCHRV